MTLGTYKPKAGLKTVKKMGTGAFTTATGNFQKKGTTKMVNEVIIGISIRKKEYYKKKVITEKALWPIGGYFMINTANLTINASLTAVRKMAIVYSTKTMILLRQKNIKMEKDSKLGPILAVLKKKINFLIYVNEPKHSISSCNKGYYSRI